MDQMTDVVVVGLVQVAKVTDFFTKVVALLLLELIERQLSIDHFSKYLLDIICDQKMLDNLGSFFFSDLINMPDKCKERIEVEKLQNAFTVLVDAFENNLVYLSVALAKIACLV